MDDGQILRYIQSNRGMLEKRLNGAIRNAINDHGPIVRGTEHSVSKRIVNALKTLVKEIKTKPAEDQPAYVRKGKTPTS